MKELHFIGIGGVGMSALAHICLDRNIKVSGSDLFLGSYTEALKKRGALICEGHSPHFLPSTAGIVYSSAIAKNNPEFVEALEKKLPLFHRSDLLALLMEGYRTLVVTGTHGKTTTSSLLTSVFIKAGKDPSFALGGMLRKEKTNGRAGKGSDFIAEADESDGSFLKYRPFGAIVTGIEREHLDFFHNEANIFASYSQFISGITSKDLLFYCIDDPHLEALVKDQGVGYGFSSKALLRIQNYRQLEWKSVFDLTFEGTTYKDIELSLTGKHNALNAAAVWGLCLRLGIEESPIREAFLNFAGVKRRCEIKACTSSILVIDDYAHHPTEIKVTLRGIKKAITPRRLIAVFQPHRYTRTRDYLEEFAKSFEEADLLFLDDIYAASEMPIENVSKERLAAAIMQHSSVPLHFFPETGACGLLSFLRPHDVVVFLGAGSITSQADTLAQALPSFFPKKFVVGVIEGGKSCEHEVSLRSAKLVKESLRSIWYDQIHFLIDKEGYWSTSTSPAEKGRPLSASILEEIYRCDLLFPIMHGPLCEDGTLQGLFELLDKPYVGSDFRGCAIAMDKALSKILVAKAGVPTAPFFSFDVEEWKEKKEEIERKIELEIGYPLFLKPIHLGSTVGVKRVGAKEELSIAADQGFRYDTALMAEKSMEGCRELEFPVMGNDVGFIEVAPPGEIFSMEMAYDYQGKYGANPIRKAERADIRDELLKKGKEMALIAYQACQCTGMARVDFFLDEKGSFWFLEINPIPGMTAKSLFPRIFKNLLGSFEAIFDKLVLLALQRDRKKNRHGKLDVM